MIDLGMYKKTVRVKLDGKKYDLRKLTVADSNIIEELKSVNDENGLQIAHDALDLIAERFKEVDPSFDVELFKKTATFEMVNVVLTALIKGEGDVGEEDGQES